ncbi:non-ribosomal peptide synthetase [Actinoplanes sp. NPDC051343]|uniref:non-ribosomal peptide synthetase n=1 Tax=Actinoplanes sp. NPDC051343 TaxID=3363906 RepID=UPI0037AA5FEE
MNIRPPVPERVQRFVERQPDRVALVDGPVVVTYGELGTRVASLVRTLRGRGVAPGSVVGLGLERSAELVIAALAVMTAGGAYLALDTTQPTERTNHMLKESGTSLVLTRSTVWPGSAELPVETLHLDRLDAGQGHEAAPDAPPAAGNDDVAYVNYTSGSTGRPKGILVEHRGLANLVDWYLEAYGITERDRLTQLVRPSFDAFALEVWPCLAAGAALHIVDSPLLRSPRELVSWLHETGVTTAFVPTPLAEELLDLEWPRREDGTVALRTMLVGGDRLHRYPPPGLPFRLCNNYGPTECTVVATWAEVVSADGADGGFPPIGRPIRNIVAYVLDENLRPAGPEALGQLYLAGAGLARGYVANPDLTEARFPADPFSSDPGARMYATGDAVRRSADGTLHFCGRTDDQIKLRGFRIEPAEVEAALLKDASVRSAAVVAHHQELLVAYVVAPGADGDMLRKRTAEILPDYMVPAAIVCVDALPATANGKIDREDLRARPLPQESEAGGGVTEQPGDVDPELVALWCEVLGLETVDPQQDFFDIGGDSLRVIRLVSKGRRRGITMRPEDIHEHPVLSDLAAVLRSRQG